MQDTLDRKDVAVSDDKSISLEINTDRLKHFFYMLHGEPSTRTRAFSGAILVTKHDVIALVNDLKKQLSLVKVTEYSITIGVGFKKDFIEKSFSEFELFEWNDPDKTQEITIKLSFLFEESNSENPLKHAVFIRIAKGIKPGNIIQLLASSDSESLDNIENLMCPVFCRTDHVHDKLSIDLIRVVEDWHSGQKQPKLLSAGFEFLRKHKHWVARAIHYSIPASIVFVFCYAAFSVPDLFQVERRMPAYVSLVISSNLVLAYFLKIGNTRAAQAFTKLGKISSEDVIFDITKGDDKEQSDAINKNRDLFKDSRSIFVWTNIQAVTASIVAAGLIEIFK